MVRFTLGVAVLSQNLTPAADSLIPDLFHIRRVVNTAGRSGDLVWRAGIATLYMRFVPPRDGKTPVSTVTGA